MSPVAGGSSHRPVTIVGAGLAGCLLACFLARRGHEVTLYERRPDPRLTGAERGRSINLALSERGLHALRRIGLAEQVMADALPMRGRIMHALDGQQSFQSYSADGRRAINSISRGALNAVLLSAATGSYGVAVHFEHRLTGLDPHTGELTLARPDGGTVEVKAEILLGADGASSAVRAALAEHGVLADTADFLDYGYKELTIPAHDGGFALDPGALHIWPRGTSMMIALPNPDASFTATLFWPNTGPGSFACLTTPQQVAAHFARVYPDLPPLAPQLTEDYAVNPVGTLVTVHTAPWQHGGRIALVGDAAHAIVPFYGQGANAAFEDCVELDRCLEEAGDDWATALPRYQQNRVDNCEAIAAMALQNFVEMRDKVASPWFRLSKRVEHTLERALPGRYVSRYELVSFSTVPYAQVRRRVRRQQRALVGAAATVLLALGAAGYAALRGVHR
jgi:kynurenine 3-monooxygenase